MEDNIEPEYECQICVDLLTEPTTTSCGHTFCKICLIRYLKINLNCPMCRKPILQSKENLAKNILLENIIKSKYSRKYEERLKILKLSYESEEDAGLDSQNNNSRNNIPVVFIKDTYIWPRLKKKIKISNLEEEPTISISAVNDRLLVILPEKVNDQVNENLENGQNSPNNNQVNSIANLVEILSYNKNENTHGTLSIFIFENVLYNFNIHRK